jgi:hypothetical protein
MHGGAAPQVKAKADERLKALLDPALRALEDAMEADRAILVSDGMMIGAHVEHEPDHPTRLRASVAVLDRTGLGPTKRLEHSGTGEDPIKIILGVEKGAV